MRICAEVTLFFLLFLSIVCVGINLETEGDVVPYAIIDYPKPFFVIHMTSY